jgi:hypothetical protein
VVSDWARFLPLSNRDRAGDSAANRDWSSAAATVLYSIASALDAQPTLLTASTLRVEVSTSAAVRDMLTELGTPWWIRWAHAIGAAPSPSIAVASIVDAALASVVRMRADELSAPGGRASIRDLGAVVILGLDVNAAHKLAIAIDPFQCGAVALDLAVRARQPQRSIITARTFIAVDSDWQLGRGPQLRTSAAAIVLFLAGRSGLPAEHETPDNQATAG